jgi:RNA polymerase subunit RPABC4/transcription elongation factor Spt4
MFCPECGKVIDKGTLFCPECGTKIADEGVLSVVSPAVSGIKRPMGVTFIMFYTVINSFLAIIVGLFISHIGFAIASGAGSLLEGLPVAAGIGNWLLLFVGLLGYLALFYGVFELTAALGLLNLAEWGRKLAVVLYIISIPIYFLSLTVQRLTVSVVFLTLVGIGISIVIILYLSSPGVKRFFQ